MEAQFSSIDDWFELRMRLVCDPYFDREFFTNIIHCIDRKKTLRDVFEASLKEIDCSKAHDDLTDRALLHLLYAYQAANYLRESYQWLPLVQGVYSLAMFRGDAKKPLERNPYESVEERGCNLEEFEKLLTPAARRVSPFDSAWGSLVFLLQNRSTRSEAIRILTEASFHEDDILTTCLVMKALEAAFASGWKNLDVILKRAFQRFWESGLDLETSEFFTKARALLEAQDIEANLSGGAEWKAEWSEELWHRVTKQSIESSWEWMAQLAKEGASLDQLFCSMDLIRGRLLYGMKTTQWPLVTESLLFSSAIGTAARWETKSKSFYLAASLAELGKLAQLLNTSTPQRPTGDHILDGISQNISKNQLILRLDDACEKGDAKHALDILAVIVKDKGLAHSVSDRLVLMASKQDGWTFDQTTLPTSLILTKAYETAVRTKVSMNLASDALFGLLRYLSDQRSSALQEVKRTGNYGDGGMDKSPFDVSGGARIVDRYVFNQMRNAQRIFIWPTEGKG